MKFQKFVIGFLLVTAASGCANHVYQGGISALDSNGKERQVVIYWTKTDPLVGEAKAGPASLLTECGIPIFFEEQETGILFRGIPGQDHLIIGEGEDGIDMVCGRFEDQNKFTEIEDGTLSVSVYCVPLVDEFSIGSRRSYLQARQDPYRFQITSRKEWSLFGKIPEVPGPLECHDE
jgi:hypothetical protein